MLPVGMKEMKSGLSVKNTDVLLRTDITMSSIKGSGSSSIALMEHI
jgi:hypothetical protein